MQKLGIKSSLVFFNKTKSALKKTWKKNITEKKNSHLRRTLGIIFLMCLMHLESLHSSSYLMSRVTHLKKRTKTHSPLHVDNQTRWIIFFYTLPYRNSLCLHIDCIIKSQECKYTKTF